MLLKMRILFFFAIVFAVFLIVLERTCYRHVEDIQVEWRRRWGSRRDEGKVEPFRIDPRLNSQAELDRKLDEFLQRHYEVMKQYKPVKGRELWPHGIPKAELYRLVDVWRYQYNWTARADKLNDLGPQYHMVINGLRIHYFDIRSNADRTKTKRPPPILLLHGWPGSFIEFVDVIPLLLAKGHDLIVPSLPGFGFSEGPSEWEDPDAPYEFTFLDAAVIFSKLMKGVHPNDKYVCQGGDYGSFVCSGLGQIDTKNILGVHLNMAVVAFPPWKVGGIFSWILIQLFPFLVSQGNRQRMGPSVPAVMLRLVHETGYFHVQGTKPDSIGAGLEDSPVFLVAWIAEKFRAWADPRDFDRITVEEVLDNVQVYWMTRTSPTTSARWYYGMMHSWNGAIASLLAPVPVKTAILDAPAEIFRPPTFWLKDHKYPKLERFTEAAHGGHFFALEYPEELASDLTAFIDSLVDSLL